MPTSSNIKQALIFDLSGVLLREEIDRVTVCKEGLSFVQQCKKANIRLLILSNWDPESFVDLQKSFPELFSLFDEHDIFIPKKLGLRKPQPQCYELVIGHLGSDYELFFVDDSSRNVVAAQECSITSVLHTNWHDTQRQLKRLGLMVVDIE
ncbi:MAG: HAD-IA family hydrolase [Candidatus Babeliales bacterium]